MTRPVQPFAKPWRLIQQSDCFEIQDSAGIQLCCIVFEDDPARRTFTKRLSKDDARRMARQVLRLPELIRIARGLDPAEA